MRSDWLQRPETSVRHFQRSGSSLKPTAASLRYFVQMSIDMSKAVSSKRAEPSYTFQRIHAALQTGHALASVEQMRKFGLIGGDIFHGRLTLDQLFSARPVLGHADHRMPVPGLYLCGSGAHPGGGVTGAPGHNAARAILADHRALFA